MENNSKKKISVIIPMYNCEDFADETLSDLSAQTLEDFEVICVIDGSADRSEEIVKKHCNEDPRFSYVYQQNGGAGKARNTGLKLASGKYILFLDSDDKYSLTMLEEMYTMAEKTDADITICSFSRINYSDGSFDINLGFDRNMFLGKDCGDRIDAKNWITSVFNRVTNKLYLKSFINKNEILCSEIKVGNDVFFDVASLCVAEKIALIRKDLLTVRRFINQDSITSHSGKRNEETFIAWRQIWEFFEKRGLSSDYLNLYCRKFFHSLEYRAGADFNPLFVKEAARTLCEEAPFKKTGIYRLNTLGGGILKTDILNQLEKETIKTAKAENPASKKTLSKLQTIQNTIHTISEIKKICKEKYGKNLF